MRKASRHWLAAAFAAAAATLPMTGTAALAQESAEEGAISIELNTLRQSERGCLLTFVAENGLGSDLEGAAYEVVLFDADGLVERLTVLDFQDLPDGRTRVRQFNIADTECDGLSRILVNDQSRCEGTDIAPETCVDRLSVASQSDVELAR